MQTKTTETRQGTIEDTPVNFTVTVELNDNQNISAAEGHIEASGDFYRKILHTTQALKDFKTNTVFSIYIAESRFSFTKSYSGIDILFT